MLNDEMNLNEPASVAAIRAETVAAGFTMASEPLAGSLLRTLAASRPGARILELGSGTGLATAWLLDGMDATARLTTVDHDESLLSILRAHLEPDARLTVVCADADAFLPALRGREFDLIFADTWAGKYRLLDDALALLAPAGMYVIDDMLPQPNWPEGHAEKAAALIDALERRPDLYVTKMSWASGILLAAKRDSGEGEPRDSAF
ncbi:MAG: class I SAM-dependent methyltransferase [Blastocatellia bacterium]|nr:class I SAM-dependent methyltransferase [Blastocatellia bacterium]